MEDGAPHFIAVLCRLDVEFYDKTMGLVVPFSQPKGFSVSDPSCFKQRFTLRCHQVFSIENPPINDYHWRFECENHL